MTVPAVQIAEGAAARSLIDDPAFLGEWERLAERCRWTTVFQEPPFVRAWYDVYAGVAEPVVVTGRSSDGNVVGLLTLARAPRSRDVTAAGDFHAEYQAWLATDEASDAFITAALRSLERAHPRLILRLAYLTPDVPIDWTRDPRWSGRIEVRARPAGIIDLHDLDAIQGSIRKKHWRSRLNRLARVGTVTLDRIDDVELAGLLDRVATLCDLRQGAVNGVMPFRDNPLKRPLHERMVQAGLFHATALRVGGDPVSVHLDVRDGDGVLLYLLVHEPAFARESPGSLHMMLLAPALASDGFRTFDLSPGEGYKDRFANRTDEAHALVVRFGWRDRSVRRAVATAASTVRWAARRLGREDTVRRSRLVAAVTAGWTGIGPGPRVLGSSLLEYIRPGRGPREGTVTRFEIDAHLVVDPLPPRHLERDAIDALLAVAPERGGRSAVRSFLADGLSRLEAGQVAYTRRSGDRLIECWWVLPVGGDPTGPGMPSTTIQVGFLDPRASPAPALVQSLREIIAAERASAGRTWCLELAPDHKAVAAAALALGFARVTQRGR